MSSCYNCQKETDKSITIGSTLYHYCSIKCAKYCFQVALESIEDRLLDDLFN